MTTPTLPAADPAILARKPAIVAGLRALLTQGTVIDQPVSLKVYETDALSVYRQPPFIVVLPGNTAEVAAVLKYCHDNGVRVVPRGAGTGLSGGALPLPDAVVVALTKLKSIRDIDYDNACVTADAGVTNLAITQAVSPRGFYYAPDPSSQVACTIGGNIAENSGGVHCLKYGLTTNNVLGIEMVTMQGDIIQLGGKHLDAGGYDLLGVMTGSEGLLGVVTAATVRIRPKPETQRALLIGFDTTQEAADVVAAVIAAGIVPAGMEMMDKLAIVASEAYAKAGYPTHVEALLIVELDGPAAEVDHLITQVDAIARQHGAVTCTASQSEEQRLKFWAGRKAAFPAMSRIAADYICMDGSIPRGKLTHVLTEITRLSSACGLRVANVFHAGDGNLHPLILFDANNPDEVAKAEKFGADILKLCVDVGGVLTGEHGVGIEKRGLMDYQFKPVDLEQQQRLKCAFDPQSLMNPGKVFPTLHRCAEFGLMHVHDGKLPHPDLPRF